MKQEALFEGISRDPLIIAPQASILLLIERTRMGMQRRLDLRKVKGLPEGMNADIVNATAKILECPELKAISSLDSEINAWLQKNALPSIFKFGAYLFSKSMLIPADAKMQDYRNRRLPLIEPFVARYTDITAGAREKLGPILSAAIAWPEPDLVPALFTLRWRWMEIGIPSDLPTDIEIRERAKFAQDLERQQTIVQAALRQGFKQLVDRLLQRLSPGTKKIIVRDSLIENLQEFISAFPNRYITDDAELKVLVQKAEQVLSGVTPEDVRGNSDLQGFLVREFERIDNALEPLVIETQTRKISFDDGDEDAPTDAFDGMPEQEALTANA